MAGSEIRGPDKPVAGSAACLALLSLVLMAEAIGSPDPDAGCPSEGCLPSGAFALSSDIPGLTTGAAISWVATVASGATPVASRLGCVSCQNALVCLTGSGYVSLNYTALGKPAWRYDNVTSPTLPILDFFGDLIGTNGRLLIKIDADGQVQMPIIHFSKDLAPMYSIQLARDYLLLLVSRSGMLITYAVNGIPEASLFLRDQIEGVNGTFVPVAQPVVSGNRSYVLTQFAPETPVPADKVSILGLQRLYAVDILARMVKRIDPVWYVNFECERRSRIDIRSKGSPAQPPQPALADEMYSSTVLVHRRTIYVSLGRPLAGCGDADIARGQEIGGTLWAFKDLGNTSKLLFKNNCSVSSLALYDNSWPPGEVKGSPTVIVRHRNTAIRRETVLWAASGQHVRGYSARNGTVLHVLNVGKLLNVTDCRITSKVMVARSADGVSERLVFAVSTPSDTPSEWRPLGSPGDGQANNSRALVLAVDVREKKAHLLWTVSAPAGSRVVGQIANVVYGASARRQGGSGEKVWKKDSGSPSDLTVKRPSDKTKVLLVAMAVSDTAEHILAIGDK